MLLIFPKKIKNNFMIRLTIFLIVLIFTFVLNLKLFGQSLNMNQFGVEQGLPQSSIACLEQDKDGNIWIGTLSGVAKYNGLKFENYSRKHGLTESRVVSSALDRNGNIWFGHWSGGLSFYDHTLKRFLDLNVIGHSINSTIQSIKEDNSGVVWIGTQTDGLFIYTPTAEEKTGKLGEKLAGKFSKISGFIGNPIHDIIQLKNGKIILATGKGIFEFENNSSKGISASERYGVPSDKYTCLIETSKDEIWFGSESNGILKTKNGKLLRRYGINDGLDDLAITALLEDKFSNVFVGTKEGGMFKYLRPLEENKYEGLIFQTISSDQGLSNNRVTDIIQDRENNIWIGTFLNLNQYFDEQFEIFGAQEGLTSTLVWSIAQDKKGRYWLGTDGGLNVFVKGDNPNSSRFENVSLKDKIVGNTTSLYIDEKGIIWFASNNSGLYGYVPESKTLLRYTVKDGLASDNVNCITGDKKGNLYIGTNGKGLSIFNFNNRTFKNLGVKDGLGSSYIYSMLFDSKGKLWLGTLNGPLTLYEKDNFKEGYNNKFTTCITEDSKGNIWLGSFEKGIYKFDGSKFTNYSMSQKSGMSSDMAFLMVCDDKDHLWIGNNLGVDRMELKNETFKHYSKHDGFLGIELNPNAVCKDNDGNLWFGSIIGVVKYNSVKEKINTAEPITSLKTPRLFFNEMEKEPEGKVFAYDQNHLTFDFVGASLTNPLRVHYKYRLEGVDTGWSPPTTQNYVTYPDLQPGSYVFKVLAANNDNIWNKEPLVYEFTIKPPFWKTWWFYTLCLIAIILGVRWYFLYQQKALMEQNRILENKVEERTEELRKEKALVEKQNQNIHESIDYASRIQHAVFVPKAILKRLLPQHFIFFKPKDNVSGDFYWAHEKKGKIYFAASDCTGHGVPGALITIIGYNMLDKIMNTTDASTPAEILGLLSQEVSKALDTQDEENKLKDGMDISICCFDPKTSSLEFAAAYNSMYLVRNKELTEYKADKIPIGKSNTNTDSKFTNHTIQIQKDDTVYLFTDGYPDQIGGPKKTKFFYPPFRKLLAEISEMPLEVQERKLDTTISEWLGQREQIDDLCIVGVKF
jgi:ligand-binding sensor domain-containing protein/serine phosphatase RsbU (regulator of sigma subunit)